MDHTCQDSKSFHQAPDSAQRIYQGDRWGKELTEWALRTSKAQKLLSGRVTCPVREEKTLGSTKTCLPSFTLTYSLTCIVIVGHTLISSSNISFHPSQRLVISVPVWRGNSALLLSLPLETVTLGSLGRCWAEKGPARWHWQLEGTNYLC